MLFVAIAVISAAVFASAANILQGPGSRGTIVGPDGSSIVAAVQGGAIVADETPGAAAYAAAPVPVATILAAPAPAAVAPVVAAPAVVAAAPAPVAFAAPVAATEGTTVYPSEDEGQYVPDNLEKLYDDGSYKGE